MKLVGPAHGDEFVFSYAHYPVSADPSIYTHPEQLSLHGENVVGMLADLRAAGGVVPVTRESFFLAFCEQYPHCTGRGILDHWDFLHTREVAYDEGEPGEYEACRGEVHP